MACCPVLWREKVYIESAKYPIATAAVIKATILNKPSKSPGTTWSSMIRMINHGSSKVAPIEKGTVAAPRTTFFQWGLTYKRNRWNNCQSLTIFFNAKSCSGFEDWKEGLQRYKCDWTEASCTQVTKICIAWSRSSTLGKVGASPVSYTHLTLPTICSV